MGIIVGFSPQGVSLTDNPPSFLLDSFFVYSLHFFHDSLDEVVISTAVTNGICALGFKRAGVPV